MSKMNDAWERWKRGESIANIAEDEGLPEYDVLEAVKTAHETYLRDNGETDMDIQSALADISVDDSISAKALALIKRVEPFIGEVEEIFRRAFPEADYCRSADNDIQGREWAWLVDGRCFDVCCDSFPDEDDNVYIFVWGYDDDAGPITTYDVDAENLSEIVEMAKLWVEHDRNRFLWREREGEDGTEEETEGSDDGIRNEGTNGNNSGDTEQVSESDAGQRNGDSPSETDDSGSPAG